MEPLRLAFVGSRFLGADEFMSRSVTVRQALVGLIAGLALPLSGLALFLIAQLVTTERNAISQNQLAAARTLAALVESEIERHIAVAAGLGSSPSLDTHDFAAFHRQARVAGSEVATWVALSSPDGRLILSTLKDFGIDLPGRTATNAAMERAVASRQPYVSDVITGNLSGQRVAVIEYPVLRQGEVTFVISIALNPASFLKFLEGKFPIGALVAILDRNRRFVARVPDHETRLGTLAAESWRIAIDAAPEGSIESVSVENVPVVTSYSSTRFGWVAGIGFSIAALNAPVRRQFWIMGSVSVAIISLGLWVALFAAGKMNRAMRQLSANAQRLAGGEVVEWSNLAVREADEVNRSLAKFSQELASRLRDLHEAREQQNFLLNETAHRLKNQLALISSMIWQTARKTSNAEEFVTRLEQRIKGLAVGIDLLVGRSWEAAPLGELIKRQLEPFVPAPESLSLKGPEVALTPDQTQALGLALHELATNAVKYGAWSNPTGTVEVHWTLEARDGENWVHIEWTERGGPPVLNPSRNGFGQTVIAQAAGRSANSSSTTRFDRQGLTWNLSMPVRSIVDVAAPQRHAPCVNQT